MLCSYIPKRGLETYHVVSGLMRGLKMHAYRHLHRQQTDIATLRLNGIFFFIFNTIYVSAIKPKYHMLRCINTTFRHLSKVLRPTKSISIRFICPCTKLLYHICEANQSHCSAWINRTTQSQDKLCNLGTNIGVM